MSAQPESSYTQHKLYDFKDIFFPLNSAMQQLKFLRVIYFYFQGRWTDKRIHQHSAAVKDVLNMACPKKIKLSNSKSSGNSAKSQQLWYNVLNALQPW